MYQQNIFTPRFYLLGRIDLEFVVETDAMAVLDVKEIQFEGKVPPCGQYQDLPVKTHHRFLRLGGVPAVPGSTIKGAVRSAVHSQDMFGTISMDSRYYFGNFLYAGKNWNTDSEEINIKGDLYEIALRGAIFRGSILYRQISNSSRLASEKDMILKALGCSDGRTFFMGMFSAKGRKGRKVENRLFGGVRFSVLNREAQK